jgi:hypothetical protein
MKVLAIAVVTSQLLASACGPCDRTWSEGSSRIEGELTLPGRPAVATEVGGLAYWGYGTWEIAAAIDDGSALVCVEVNGVELTGTYELAGLEALACTPPGGISGDYPPIDHCGNRDQCEPLAGRLTVVELEQQCQDRSCAARAMIELEASTQGGVALAITGWLDEELVEGCSGSPFL